MYKIILCFTVCFFISVGIFAQNLVSEAQKHLEEGQISKAKAIFQKNEEVPLAIERLGDIASFQKKWDEAIVHYSKLVDLYPESANYNFKLGGALGLKAMEGSKFEAALLLGDIKRHLKNAAEIDPKHPEVRRALVEFYMEIPKFVGGSKSVATTYANQLKEINKLDALLSQAYILRADGETEAAVRKYSEAILLAKSHPDYITRNYLYYELGYAASRHNIHSEIGLEFLSKYLKGYGYKDLKSPTWVFLRMAQIKANQKLKTEALTLIEKVLAEMPDLDTAKDEKERILRL